MKFFFQSTGIALTLFTFGSPAIHAETEAVKQPLLNVEGDRILDKTPLLGTWVEKKCVKMWSDDKLRGPEFNNLGESSLDLLRRERLQRRVTFTADRFYVSYASYLDKCEGSPVGELFEGADGYWIADKATGDTNFRLRYEALKGFHVYAATTEQVFTDLLYVPLEDHRPGMVGKAPGENYPFRAEYLAPDYVEGNDPIIFMKIEFNQDDPSRIGLALTGDGKPLTFEKVQD